MTIQLHVGLQSVQTASKETTWVASSQHASPANLSELNQLDSKLHYTSLRDLMVVSPTKDASQNGKALEWCNPSQVMFKHELLKQAARAYLQPTGRSTPPKVHLFEKIWKSFMTKNKAMVASAKDYVWSRAEACMRFLTTRALSAIRRIKQPHHLKFRRATRQVAQSEKNWTLKRSVKHVCPRVKQCNSV